VYKRLRLIRVRIPALLVPGDEVGKGSAYNLIASGRNVCFERQSSGYPIQRSCGGAGKDGRKYAPRR
jgi:hypothetical protein